MMMVHGCLVLGLFTGAAWYTDFLGSADVTQADASRAGAYLSAPHLWSIERDRIFAFVVQMTLSMLRKEQPISWTESHPSVAYIIQQGLRAYIYIRPTFAVLQLWQLFLRGIICLGAEEEAADWRLPLLDLDEEPLVLGTSMHGLPSSDMITAAHTYIDRLIDS